VSDKYELPPLHQLEQSLAAVAENFPPTWRRMYLNLIAEGFSEEQAMELMRAYVHGLGNGRLQ
jgi:hypothetical protein